MKSPVRSGSVRAAVYEPFKLTFDRCLAAVGVLALLPVMAVVAALIFLDDPGPVLFRQSRAGRGHRPFTIYKFRTMKRNTPNVSTEEMRRLKLSPYTRIGPFLRRTSLDELPQLLNVLRGEMSLVGPRPALMTQQVVLSGREAAGVDQLRPGITGLAQITGRDDLPDEEKIRRDMAYLHQIGPLTDIIILFYTLRGVLGARGAY
ncbi:sugar transferase [Deinococcus metallilatus]|uniref:Lipopolysaccharide/colanic/teichoic acid biosynthesis glycosyltransferase n=1 Tax=Deinococcus metallilatus TaxID=1211322 RepID=A0AAJ5K3Q3_9DEIO|nr:sugar transferase [Deinococcus metallilatus]MBB5297035.1 lipopolysaccharide/colanic/teichoic acid biosynthesis glycosyltransferase [Deinococcus metallilatus]QBY07836.1 sugar transferase [Deinococcus metallilatus]RXJ13185.1 sugar transferase [Deinococcus metallilatus]TLK23042.1 sugar transferase [Deinococcus metallilatus]GMA16001.1 sugar transferase [Deinococcus metallilatus]